MTNADQILNRLILGTAFQQAVESESLNGLPISYRIAEIQEYSLHQEAENLWIVNLVWSHIPGRAVISVWVDSASLESEEDARFGELMAAVEQWILPGESEAGSAMAEVAMKAPIGGNDDATGLESGNCSREV